MNITKDKTLIFILVTSFLLFSGNGYSAPKFPPPPDSKIGLLGDDMVVNGVPMYIRQFISRKSVEEVLQFYRDFWPEGTPEKPGYTETDVLTPWQIITRVENGYLMTVQVTHEGDNGSSGLLGMSKLPDPDNLPKLGDGFPKLNGSNVTNDIHSKDIGKDGRTVQLLNKYSVEHNATFYINHYTGQGYGIDMDQKISGGDTHNLRFSNSSKNVTIVIHRTENGSVVIAQTEY